MTDIKSMTLRQLEELISRLGHKPFRAKQISAGFMRNWQDPMMI